MPALYGRDGVLGVVPDGSELDVTPPAIRIWRDTTRRLWDEYEGDLMSLRDTPDGECQNLDSLYVHTEFGPLTLVWAGSWWACVKPGCATPHTEPGDCPEHWIPLVKIGPDGREA
jgi:hypothetical protein